MTTQISLPLIHQGKVGDVYDAGNGYLLLVRSDRTSGFNVKLSTEIPGKGVILNQMSQWWMEGPLKDVVANHLTGLSLSDFVTTDEAEALSGRAVIVKKLIPILVEAVVRRHLTGSGWEAYQETGAVCGITLPPRLQNGDRLVEPIFTPTEKSHNDPPIDFQQMQEKIGSDLAYTIRQVSLTIFDIAESYLADRGINLADMKLEFGLDENGILTLMDEVLTPDSSRFWLKGPFEVSRKIVSLDKQKIRDWLTQQKERGLWDGKSPIALPPELVLEVSADYELIFKSITVDPVALVVIGSASD